MALLIEREACASTTSSARRSTTTPSRSTTSRTRCGRFSPMWRRCSTRPGPNTTSNSASSFRASPAPSAPCDLIVRIGDTIHVIDFKFGAGVRVLALYPRRRRGRHQRAAAVLRRGRAPLAPRILCRRRRHRSDHPAAAVDRARRRDGVVASRSRTPNSTSSSRSIAPPAKKRSRLRRAWSGAPIAASARRGRSARRIPVRCSIWRNSQVPTPAALPSKEAYLQAARGRLEPGRRGQGHRQGAARPGEARARERRPRARLRALGRPRRAPLARR